MKNGLKWIGIVMLVIISLLLILFLVINSADIPSYDIEPIEYAAHSNPQVLERGEKLVSMLCANCHISSTTGRLSGTVMADAPPEFGKIYAPNITQHKVHGIGNWSDADLLRLLRTGIKKNGQYAPPYMAKLPTMADDDMNAIIAFLRSDHSLVASDPSPNVPSEPSFLTKMLCRVIMKPFPMPSGPIPMPDTTNTIKWGEYLAHNLECFSCHSADFKTNDFLTPQNSQGYFGGGNKPLDKDGHVVLTSNLTPHIETGIGNWSKEQFIRTTKFGVKDGEQGLRYPMMPYAQLSNEEAGAIYDYLMTIPAIDNMVNRSDF